MKDKAIYMAMIDPKYAVEKGIKKVSIPIYGKDKEYWYKINGDFRAEISQIRNPAHHRKLFAILKIAVDNGILDKIGNSEIDSFITAEKIEILKLQYKEDEEVLRYILKLLFIPLETIITAAFKKELQVSSIKFSKMDQLQFTDFYDKVIDYIAIKLNINRMKLEREGV